MDQLPIGKILAVITVAVIVVLSKSENPYIADVGSKLGFGILGLGVILFIIMRASGNI